MTKFVIKTLLPLMSAFACMASISKVIGAVTCTEVCAWVLASFVFGLLACALEGSIIDKFWEDDK